MDGWMDGWMDGCMHGWMEWMDGWMYKKQVCGALHAYTLKCF